MIDDFFKLVRSGLYGTELSKSELSSVIDWKQLLALTHSQTLQGVVADAVMRLPSDVEVPKEVKRRLMDKALNIAQSHALLNEKVAEVVRFFREQGIRTILLKGQGVARNYRNPLMRQCGDIDLYIGMENYQKAARLAKQKLETDDNDPYETIKHYHFNSGEVAIDLHHTAASETSVRGEEFKEWIASLLAKDEQLRQVEMNGEQVNLPPVFFDAFFIFYHAWRHLTFGGVGLRQLCDWAMVLDKYHDQIDLEELERVLRRYRLLRPWQIFGNIVVDRLGVPKEKMPFHNPRLKRKGEVALKIILEGGNFGFFSKEYNRNIEKLPFVRRNWLKLRKSSKHFGRLAQIVPVDATMNFVGQVSRGGARNIARLFKRKK